MQRIKEESGGRLDITLYTNTVLGGDTAMISQTIAGALEMYTLPLDLLAAKNPACGILVSAMPSSATITSGRRWTVT
jgi:TRAP-type transport system periplasmic protein